MRKLERQKKTEVFAPKPDPKTPEEWEKIVRREFEQTRKLLRKHQQKQNGANVFGFADALIKRRMRAVLNTIDEVYSRYSIPSFLQYTLGELWTELNMPFMSYAHLDVQGHILFAASIWILDRITCREDWRQLYHLLPEDDRILDELCLHDAWDSQYDYELIYSVEHVLHYRNPVETDASGDPCTLTSELLAQGKVDRESQDRKNYESLIAMIPQKDIDRAVAHFKEYFWQWTDRLFEYAEPIIGELADCENRIQEGQIKCNDLIDSMNAAIDRAEKQRKKQKTSSLVMNGAPKNILEITKPKALSAFPVSVAPGIGMPKTETESGTEVEVDMSKKVMRNSYKVTGFRVQAFAGGNTREDKRKAEEARDKIKRAYPSEPVYVHFYSPRWICRVGNYRTQEEANRMLRNIRNLGYRQAVVVKGKITVQY